MNVRGVLWDLDGTLVDSEPLHDRATRQTLESAGVRAPESVLGLTTGLDATAVHKYFVERLGLNLDFNTWVERKHKFYVKESHRLGSRRGAIELYRDLATRGIPQAIVSNSDRILVNANLRAIGLESAGMISVSRNDVRDGKPAPEPYVRAAWLLGQDPHALAAVEDSAIGVLASLRAGVQTYFWPESCTASIEGATLVLSSNHLRSHFAANDLIG